MMRRSPAQPFLLLGSLFAGTAVAAGAFGAHALKWVLDAPQLAVFDTATRYQMYHAFGLFVVAFAIDHTANNRLARAGWLFTGGVIVFSGSLYLVSLAGIRWMGAVTPIGGLALLAGWIFLGWETWKSWDSLSPLH